MRRVKRDMATADFFMPRAEQATLFSAGMANDGGWVKPMTEPPAAPLYVPNVDRWPAEAAEIAKRHADRSAWLNDEACACGACMYAREDRS